MTFLQTVIILKKKNLMKKPDLEIISDKLK